MEEILSLDKVVKFYPPNCRAVNEVSFNLLHNQHICIYGEGGSGKTTLMKLISGLIKPDAGKITLFQKITEDMSEKEIATLRIEKISIVSKDIELIDELTLFENIILPRTISNTAKQEYESAARDIMKTLGIQQISDSLPYQVSPYQRYLACIARAVIGKPALLLFDSFDYSLSPAEREKAWEYLNVISKFSDTSMVFFADYPIKQIFISKFYQIKNGMLKEA